MEEQNKPRRDTDVTRLGRIGALSWLSLPELTRLVELLTLANLKRHEVIVGEDALAPEAHILITGAANITCLRAPSAFNEHAPTNERETPGFGEADWPISG